MKFVILIASLFIGSFIFSQNEIGSFSIKNFGQDDFNSQVQNFYITQDNSGIIYVGNKEGILEYRGGMWRIHKLSNVNDARAISISDQGIIYVGGINEFGYFNLDTNTTVEQDTNKNQKPRKVLKYFSLRENIDSTINFGDILGVETQGKLVYFLSRNYLFVWDQKELKTISSENLFNGFLKYHDDIYVRVNKYGIQKIANGGLVPIRINRNFLVDQDDNKIEVGKAATKALALGHYIEYNNEWNLAFSQKKNFYLFKIEEGVFKTKPYYFKSLETIKDFNVSSFIKINDKEYAFGSYDKGIILTTNTGDVLLHLDVKTGLGSDNVNSLYFDRQKHLWAALGQGISRVKLANSWESFFEKKSGYTGIIESVNRFNGWLYTCSGSGLFKLNKPATAGERSHFVKVDDPLVEMGCYSLLNFSQGGKKLMLIITNDGVAAMDISGSISLVVPGFIWSMMQDRKDPNRVWLGLDDGLASIYFNGKSFDVEGRVPGFKEQVHFMEQDNEGNLWTVLTLSRVAVLSDIEFTDHKVSNFSVKKYTDEDGLPSDNALFPKNLNGEVVMGTGEGIYTLDTKTNRFIPYDKLGPLFKNTNKNKGQLCHRIYEDEKHNIWLISKNLDETKLRIYKCTQVNDSGYYTPNKVFETKGKGDIFNTIFEDESNVVWFGGVTSLYKYSQNVKADSIPEFYTYIYQVTAGEDTVMAGYEYINHYLYTSQQPDEKEIIEYKNNKLTFYYASLLRNNEGAILYSYLLEGFENKWSKWDVRNEERFTNLPEGTYTFRVKSMDVLGNISHEATYHFEILPPWYRTIWAYIGYFLFFVAFVWGAITVSTRSLKKIIREATAEIQEQKDELEEKNQNIIDSIQYAKRIQEAVTPTDSQMKKFFPEHFVLWRPRDIVSGDFYWMMHKNDKVVVAAADCTGHGVPGAFMSIMGISFLNQIANMPEVKNAADALNHLRTNVITSLNQEGSETDTKDGMDISLCVYDFKNMIMEFSGAYNPLYMIRDGELSVIKADRMPVGVHDRMNKPFTNNKFTIMKGDVFYILSDGYIDQFGGEKGKKFMTKRFKELLLTLYEKPMEEQSRILEETLLAWRGEIEQVDDIIIIGVRIV